jgi:aerobic-type carbon monoxide dehydrogenase small subunit (CoxS/CutS family)
VHWTSDTRAQEVKATFNIDSKTRELDVPPDMPLLWLLREQLAFPGTNYACSIAQCGYCQSGKITSAVA